MEFKGLLKLTLLDYPGKLACTLFSGGCNFRCPYCHNASLVFNTARESYGEDEILDFLGKRKGILDGVCFTGGEPLLYSRIGEFMAKVKEMGFLIKLDTNGSMPDKLKELLERNLIDYVAMDIKQNAAKYSAAAGVKADIESIEKSAGLLINGSVDYEFRTTVCQELFHVEDFEGIGKLISGAKIYFLQNFKDSGDLIQSGFTPMSDDALQAAKAIVQRYVGKACIRGE